MPPELETSGFGTESEQPEVSSEPTVVEDSLGNQFLAKIPEQDRPIVQKYIKDWDANVTKKFQDYASKLKPYQALGDPDEVQKYVNFGRNFRTNPEARNELFRQMWGAYQQQFGDEFEPKLLELLRLQQEQEMNDQEYEYEGDEEPDEFTVFQQNVTQTLEQLSETVGEIVGERESQQEMAQLDNIIQAMHTKFGDFNDRFILAQLATGADIPTAMAEWNKVKEEFGTQGNRRQPPRTIGGGQGGVPNEQVDTSKLKGKDRRNAVMAFLEAADQ